MVLVLLFSLLHKQVTLWLLTPSCLSMIAVLFYVSCEFSDRKVFCTGVLWLAECVFNYREEREGRRWRGHCSHSPWAVPFTGETRTGLHSVSFVWTLCSENPFISDIYEDLVYIFVFGYYLRLCSHFGMHHPQYGRTQMKRKRAFTACLKQGSKPSSCLIFLSQVGEEVTKFESLLWFDMVWIICPAL